MIVHILSPVKCLKRYFGYWLVCIVLVSTDNGFCPSVSEGITADSYLSGVLSSTMATSEVSSSRIFDQNIRNILEMSCYIDNTIYDNLYCHHHYQNHVVLNSRIFDHAKHKKHLRNVM